MAVVWEEGRWDGGGFRRGGGRKGWRRTKPLCGHPGEVIGRLAGQKGEGEVICAGSASDSCERREGREKGREPRLENRRRRKVLLYVGLLLYRILLYIGSTVMLHQTDRKIKASQSPFL